MGDPPRTAPESTNMLRISTVFVGFLQAALMVLAACDPGQTVGNPPGTVLPSPDVCVEGEVITTKGCVKLPEIKVDTVGYILERAKLATVPGGDHKTFEVVDADTDETVFEGTLSDGTDNSKDTGDTTQIADFTEVKSPGTYVIRVKGLADSPPFEIQSDAWNDALRVTMLGLYGLRCGQKVEFEHLGSKFSHAACHKDDAIYGATLTGSAWSGGEKRDGSGGWHDAGDYGKYTVNASFALAFLFKAWEDFGDKLSGVKHIPSYEGDMPQWLAEGKYQMDQLLKMQLPDGSALHMIGPPAFPGSVMPESDFTVRHFTGIGTAATADLVAVAAIASRVFRSLDPEYADTCLAAARAGLEFLDANPTAINPFSGGAAGFTHAAYNRSQDVGERFWAMSELWRATDDAALLARVEAALPASVPMNFDWGNVDTLGTLTYVQSDLASRDPAKLDAAKAAVMSTADKLVAGAKSHAYGRGIGAMYYWGSNGVLARSVINLMVAGQVSGDEKYLDAAVQQVDHLFGRNPFGRTMVTGVGFLPAQSPHHRPSQGDGNTAPWPGLLVGGTNSQDSFAPKSPALPPGLVWFDNEQDYYVNEVAINWNTALAYALAGFYQ